MHPSDPFECLDLHWINIFFVKFSIDIDACASSPCLNGGICNQLPVGYTCNCHGGFTGVHCETGMRLFEYQRNLQTCDYHDSLLDIYHTFWGNSIYARYLNYVFKMCRFRVWLCCVFYDFFFQIVVLYVFLRYFSWK